ncbi:hypothetical protein ANANG_G00105350, partial [Anguilla anguilla]
VSKHRATGSVESTVTNPHSPQDTTANPAARKLPPLSLSLSQRRLRFQQLNQPEECRRAASHLFPAESI